MRPARARDLAAKFATRLPVFAAPMLLVSGGIAGSQWDDVMFHLARWLVRHLDDPGLVIWIAQRGGQLHERWAWLIEHELDRLASLEREGKTTELDEIRLQAPKAIPGPLMRTLWRLRQPVDATETGEGGDERGPQVIVAPARALVQRLPT